MADLHKFAVFRLDAQRYALPIADVERIVPIVEITPLSGAPEIISGVINVAGAVIPVIDMRRRLNIPAKDVEATDTLVVARAKRRVVALHVDQGPEVIECGDDAITPSEDIAPKLGAIKGVCRLKDGLILINDIGLFLSLDEEKALDDALGSKKDRKKRPKA